MKFEDIGVITDIRKHSENSAIVKIFSKNHGIYKGFVKNAFSKKSQSIFQVGNLISFEWRSRAEEGLGNFFYCDIIKSYSSRFIFDKLRLSCFISLISIINNNFHEREILDNLYSRLIDVLEVFSGQDFGERRVIADYIILEFNILSQLGYGMDLSRCAVSSSKEDLAYVSPKSGRAVSKEVGEPYSAKILSLPGFIHSYANNLVNQNDYDNDSIKISNEDILNGLKLTEFFLEKHIFSEQGQCNKHRITTVQNITLFLNK